VSNLTWESFRAAGINPLDRYYAAGAMNSTAATTGSPLTDNHYLLPLLMPRRCIVDRLAFRVTTGVATSVARIGLYDCRDWRAGNIYPNRCLFPSGEFDCSGAAATKEAACRVQLEPGLYWLDFIAGTSSPTIRCFAAASMFPIVAGNSTLGANFGMGLLVSSTYGQLPGVMDDGAAQLATTPIPSLYVHIAEYQD